MASSHRLKVGIDFGTTFSGVAWTHTSKPDEVVLIQEWPGSARRSEKVPSEITYTPAGDVHRWGFQIKPGEERVAWIKLLLDINRYGGSNSQSPRSMDTVPMSGSAVEKLPVEVVADYLGCLRKHTMEILVRSYGKAFVDATPIDYILTVPAIWSDASKSLTIQAAEAAGFGKSSNIELMSEPDAAAAWTLLMDIQPNKLNVHDAFVVVDCGGGTVDLISYEVVKLAPEFTVKECVKGTGELCGSTYLNQGFEDLVKSRLGRRYEQMKTAPRNRMKREFEEVLKRSFSNDEDDDAFTCPVGGLADDPAAGIEDGGMVLTREDMQGIFDPVINQIIPLVREQIEMIRENDQKGLKIAAVLLVGGFGASKYLRQRLEMDLMTTAAFKASPFEILQPINSWSAVVRGAALGISISSRRARQHYGTEFWHWFRHGKDPIKNLTYCQFTGKAQCCHRMQWYINKGDEVSEDHPLSFPFYRMMPLNSDLTFIDELFSSDEITAPEYKNEAGIVAPKKLCTIVSDLNSVPKKLFTKLNGGSGQYYDIRYTLVMTVKSAMLEFHLELQGKQYGKVSVKYAHA